MTWELGCGNYTLYIIEDAYYWRDPGVYHAESTEQDWRFHTRNEEGLARMNFGCFLLTDGEHTFMVDSGIGELGSQDMTAGLMPAAVDALGVPRESVETVVYSHMHYDHIGGIHRGGEVVFPNARHVFHVEEWEFWKEAEGEFGKIARRVMEPLLDTGAVDFIDRAIEIFPGVTVRESFGHTPGHVSVGVESDGTSTLIGGDLSNHPFQVEHPYWSLPVDNDHQLAGSFRESVFESIQDTETRFLAGHYPMPGTGKVVTEDGVRVFSPLSVPLAG
jgi:glyoxylase-like metal-dependent hydrolase (beta-lactamase superfamily II)